MTGEETRHETVVRQRKRTWTATCTCGWTSGFMSAFAAWSATRRHLTDAGAPHAPLSPPRRPVAVRLLDSEEHSPA